MNIEHDVNKQKRPKREESKYSILTTKATVSGKEEDNEEDFIESIAPQEMSKTSIINQAKAPLVNR